MLQLAGVAVDPLSVGGVETCIQLPGFDVAFDIGRCPRSAVSRSTILFTHAHMDHMGGVATHAATRSLIGAKPPTYVIPRENVDAFAELFAAWRRLDKSDLSHEVVPLSPGESHRLPCRLLARAFRSPHRVPCIGYTLWEQKRKLKAELRGKPGREIAALRAKGVDVTDVVEAPLVAFTGDTMIEVVDREPSVRQAKLLIMEVTFLDDRVSREHARSTGHVHLDEVIERAELFENQALLFTHFSARYSADQIQEILDRRLPQHLRERVTPLLDGHQSRSRPR